MQNLTKQKKRSNLHYVKSVTLQIVRHPHNRYRKVRALVRACAWQAYKRLFRRPIDVRVYSSLMLRCYPDSGSASNVIYFGDLYETDEMLFISRYLRPGDGFIDGGANIGTYSLLAASLVGPQGMVEAFEPHPLAAARLRENVSLNHLESVHVHQDALGERNGRTKLTARMDVSNRVLASPELEADAIEVEIVTLDERVAKDQGWAMAKLDLEGSELSALRGFTAHLRRSNPPVLQLEALEGRLRKLGSSRADLISLLVDHGYDIAHFDSDNGALVFGLEPGKRNFFAIARSARAMVTQRLDEG